MEEIKPLKIGQKKMDIYKSVLPSGIKSVIKNHEDIYGI